MEQKDIKGPNNLTQPEERRECNEINMRKPNEIRKPRRKHWSRATTRQERAARERREEAPIYIYPGGGSATHGTQETQIEAAIISHEFLLKLKNGAEVNRASAETYLRNQGRSMKLYRIYDVISKTPKQRSTNDKHGPRERSRRSDGQRVVEFFKGIPHDQSGHRKPNNGATAQE